MRSQQLRRSLCVSPPIAHAQGICDPWSAPLIWMVLLCICVAGMCMTAQAILFYVIYVSVFYWFIADSDGGFFKQHMNLTAPEIAAGEDELSRADAMKRLVGAANLFGGLYFLQGTRGNTAVHLSRTVPIRSNDFFVFTITFSRLFINPILAMLLFHEWDMLDADLLTDNIAMRYLWNDPLLGLITLAFWYRHKQAVQDLQEKFRIRMNRDDKWKMIQEDDSWSARKLPDVDHQETPPSSSCEE